MNILLGALRKTLKGIQTVTKRKKFPFPTFSVVSQPLAVNWPTASPPHRVPLSDQAMHLIFPPPPPSLSLFPLFLFLLSILRNILAAWNVFCIPPSFSLCWYGLYKVENFSSLLKIFSQAFRLRAFWEVVSDYQSNLFISGSFGFSNSS